MEYLIVEAVASERQGDVTRNDEREPISVTLTVVDSYRSITEAVEEKEPGEQVVELLS